MDLYSVFKSLEDEAGLVRGLEYTAEGSVVVWSCDEPFTVVMDEVSVDDVWKLYLDSDVGELVVLRRLNGKVVSGGFDVGGFDVLDFVFIDSV